MVLLVEKPCCTILNKIGGLTFLSMTMSLFPFKLRVNSHIGKLSGSSALFINIDSTNHLVQQTNSTGNTII